MKVGIVGAGLVGSLFSVFLAKRGISSVVFEKRSDSRKQTTHAGRSINLAISTRGLSALKKVGLEEKVLEKAVPMIGRMIHFPSTPGSSTSSRFGKSGSASHTSFQRYGKTDQDCIYSISRAFLNQVLMTAAEESGRVVIEFDQNHVEIAFRGPPEINGQKFDWIVGCDGAGSQVRSQILELSKGEAVLQTADYGYKELILPAQGNEFALSPNALHIWPRGKFMLIALPNFDKSFTCTLFLPMEGPGSFETLQSPQSVKQFFSEHFSDIEFPDLEKVFFSNPTGTMSTVRCYPWNYSDKAVLLGDAAHAILPFFGQGMNCGFEDCSVLNDLLESHPQERPVELFSQFSKLRKANADAIADMAIENFVEMRDHVGDPQFLLRKSVETQLLEKFPKDFVSRYSLVTFSTIPYQLAMQLGRTGDEILNELCAGLKHSQDLNLDAARALISAKMTSTLNLVKENYHGPWT